MSYPKWLIPIIIIAAACNTEPDAVTPSTPGLIVYPNPATSDVNISVDFGMETTVRVFDSDGELIYKSVGMGGYTTILLGGRPTGVYHVIAQTDRQTLTRQFIKL